MFIRALLFLCLAGILSSLEVSQAQSIPHRLTYQGRITNDAGAPVTAVTPIEFRFFDGANQLFALGAFNVTPTAQGSFSQVLQLSEAQMDNVTAAGDPQLQLVVNGIGMEPKTKITSAIFAAAAGRLIGEANVTESVEQAEDEVLQTKTTIATTDVIETTGRPILLVVRSSGAGLSTITSKNNGLTIFIERADCSGEGCTPISYTTLEQNLFKSDANSNNSIFTTVEVSIFPGSLTTIDFPAAGRHVYRLSASSSNPTGGNIENVQLVAVEL